MNCTTCISRGRAYPASEKNTLDMCEFCFEGKPHPVEMAEKRERLLKLAAAFTKTRSARLAVPIKQRRRATYMREADIRAFAQPYLKNASERACVLCSKPKKKFSTYCEIHRKFMAELLTAKSYLRSFKKSPESLKLLRAAVHTIQRYGVTPDDLKYV